MRVYIVSEKTDKRGHLTKMIQVLRGVPDVPRIFLCSESDINPSRAEKKAVDDLIRKHFSIEDLVKEE